MDKVTYNSSESFERLQALLHYVCDKAEDPKELGRVKLNKVPWYADTIAYMIRGSSITGERYIKRQFGPVPAKFVPALRKLEEDGKIVKGKLTVFNLTKHEFTSRETPDLSKFTAEELEIINQAYDHVCLKNTAKSISNETHNHIWQYAEIGEEIPLQTVFATQFAEITEDDMAWARSELEEAKAA